MTRVTAKYWAILGSMLVLLTNGAWGQHGSGRMNRPWEKPPVYVWEYVNSSPTASDMLSLNLAEWQPANFVLEGPDGPLVEINLETGAITYGKSYTPDKAAKVFWDVISQEIGAQNKCGQPEAEGTNRFHGESK